MRTKSFEVYLQKILMMSINPFLFLNKILAFDSGEAHQNIIFQLLGVRIDLFPLHTLPWL